MTAVNFGFFEHAIFFVDRVMRRVVNVPTECFKKRRNKFGARGRFLIFRRHDLVAAGVKVVAKFADASVRFFERHHWLVHLR